MSATTAYVLAVIAASTITGQLPFDRPPMPAETLLAGVESVKPPQGAETAPIAEVLPASDPGEAIGRLKKTRRGRLYS